MHALSGLKKFLVRTIRPAPSTRSTRPASDVYGFDRGTPLDRYYIEAFLASYANDIKGHVLEMQDDGYTRRFGQGVTKTDVLDRYADNTRATVRADLAAADAIASNTFDCFVLTQTLQFIYDVKAALFHVHRILKPGGVLLATVPATARVDPELYASDYWRFTPSACRRLCTECFGEGHVTVTSFGNALSCAGHVNGLASEEFSKHELDPVDSYFPLIVGIRAVKARQA